MKTKASYGTSITKIDEEQLDLNTFFLYNDISVFELEKLKKSNQKEYESIFVGFQCFLSQIVYNPLFVIFDKNIRFRWCFYFKKYTTYTELVFTTKASAYELYAHYLDKK